MALTYTRSRQEASPIPVALRGRYLCSSWEHHLEVEIGDGRVAIVAVVAIKVEPAPVYSHLYSSSRR